MRSNGEIIDKEAVFKQYIDAISEEYSAFILDCHRPEIYQLSLGYLAARVTVVVRRKV